MKNGTLLLERQVHAPPGMSSLLGSVGSKLVACVALVCLLASLCEARALFQKKVACGKPPSGSWLVVHRGIDLETIEPTVAGRTVLSLREDFDNAFAGASSFNSHPTLHVLI